MHDIGLSFQQGLDVLRHRGLRGRQLGRQSRNELRYATTIRLAPLEEEANNNELGF